MNRETKNGRRKHLVSACLAGAALLPLSSNSIAQNAEKPTVCDAAALADETSPAISKELQRAEVQTGVPLRSGPSAECDISYRAPAGGTVEVVVCEDEWCYVAYGAESGYVPAAVLDPMPDRTPDID